MRNSIEHIVAVCLAALLLLPVGCGRNEAPVPDSPESVLLLNIETVGGTRAGKADLPANEKIHSLRVVVLHQDGKVEHNRHYTPGDAQAQRQVILKVTPAERKRIYLFSNEESVSRVEGAAPQTLTEFLDGYTEGTAGFAQAVGDVYFAPDYSEAKPIPMSSMYEIDFPATGNFNGEFHLVRVATKFTVNFRNMRGEAVRVNGFSLGKHADRNFLMAHVRNTERNRQLFGVSADAWTEWTWIDWLKRVSDASSEDDDYAATEAAGWLKDYSLPAGADGERVYTFSTPVDVSAAEFDDADPAKVTPGTATGVFYLPESRNMKSGAMDDEQEYTMTVSIDGVADPFVFALPNLKALFRNTNVIVNITMNRNMVVTVDVIPYAALVLNPTFGVDVPDNEQPPGENNDDSMSDPEEPDDGSWPDERNP